MRVQLPGSTVCCNNQLDSNYQRWGDYIANVVAYEKLRTDSFKMYKYRYKYLVTVTQKMIVIE